MIIIAEILSFVAIGAVEIRSFPEEA